MRKLIIALLLIPLMACASIPKDARTEGDPFESFNRSMLNTHLVLERWVLDPLSSAYNTLPRPIRSGTSNFLSNLLSPLTLVNDLLQGNIKQAGKTFARFFINTIWGFGGLMDFAAMNGLEARKEDFGQTLAVYGIPQGPYLFIPLLGPTSFRDITGRGLSIIGNPIRYNDVARPTTIPRNILHGVDVYARNKEFIKEAEKTSIDYYTTIRTLYLQNRQNQIDNGKTDIDTLPDIDDIDGIE